MRVLLINPPYPFEESPTPPFGLASLAAYLLERGVEVRLEDYVVTHYSREQVQRVLNDYRPNIIGATAVTMNINRGLRIIRDCKELYPEAVTVMGGPHVTFDADNILKDNPSVDYVVRREGELTFYEMVERMDASTTFDDIEGLSFCRDGKVVHNPPRPLIPDINVLPYPARHLLQLSKYKALGFPINMTTSRGCPNKCIFCVGSKMVGRRVRHFDVPRVVDEFAMLAKLGFRQINIVDDCFTTHRRRCTAICDEITRRGVAYPWTAFARVDNVTRELLESMKRSGCIMLCFGIESGNQEILDRVKKRITLEKCQKAMALCNEVGLPGMTSYILGLPGETPETVEETLRFAKELSPHYGFHVLAPFPGTEVREKCDEYGIRILTDDWDQYDANRSVCETDYISAAEINVIADHFNLSIKRYLDELGEQKKRGEPISPQGEELINNLNTFAFVERLMMEELIERYPVSPNGCTGEEIVRNFIVYVDENTKFTQDEIRREVNRLIELNCISIDPKSVPQIRWRKLMGDG